MTAASQRPSGRVLHLDLVLLREDIGQKTRLGLYEDARALRELPGILSAGLIEALPGSDFDLAFFFLLDTAASLEAFGTDERYVRFLQGGVARAMRSFGGADVQVFSGEGGEGAFAACLALAASPQTYDWQVRDSLAAWASPLNALAGLAIGERQRYRGVGIMFANQPIPRPLSGVEGFGVDFVSGPCRMLS